MTEYQQGDAPERTPRKKPNTKKRAENRPRLDAILRAIKDGRFDEELGQIQGAINDRNRKRQEAVLALVQQTFGDGYTVIPTKNASPVSPVIPAIVSTSGVFADNGDPPEGWRDETPPLVKEPGEDDPDIESHSPIIS